MRKRKVNEKQKPLGGKWHRNEFDVRRDMSTASEKGPGQDLRGSTRRTGTQFRELGGVAIDTGTVRIPILLAYPATAAAVVAPQLLFKKLRFES